MTSVTRAIVPPVYNIVATNNTPPSKNITRGRQLLVAITTP